MSPSVSRELWSRFSLSRTTGFTSVIHASAQAPRQAVVMDSTTWMITYALCIHALIVSVLVGLLWLQVWRLTRSGSPQSAKRSERGAHERAAGANDGEPDSVSAGPPMIPQVTDKNCWTETDVTCFLEWLTEINTTTRSGHSVWMSGIQTNWSKARSGTKQDRFIRSFKDARTL